MQCSFKNKNNLFNVSQKGQTRLGLEYYLSYFYFYTASGEFLKYTASSHGVVKFAVSKTAPAVPCLPSCEFASTRVDVLARIMWSS